MSYNYKEQANIFCNIINESFSNYELMSSSNYSERGGHHIQLLSHACSHALHDIQRVAIDICHWITLLTSQVHNDLS